MSDPTPGPWTLHRRSDLANSWHEVCAPGGIVLTSSISRDADVVGEVEDAANGAVFAAAEDMLAALECQEAMERYYAGQIKLGAFHAVLTGFGWDGTGRDSDFVRELRRRAIERANGGEAGT